MNFTFSGLLLKAEHYRDSLETRLEEDCEGRCCVRYFGVGAVYGSREKAKERRRGRGNRNERMRGVREEREVKVMQGKRWTEVI